MRFIVLKIDWNRFQPLGGTSTFSYDLMVSRCLPSNMVTPTSCPLCLAVWWLLTEVWFKVVPLVYVLRKMMNTR
jgi:hypothetical protein